MNAKTPRQKVNLPRCCHLYSCVRSQKRLEYKHFKKSHECICNRDLGGGDDSDTEKLTLLKHFLLRNKNKIS